MAKYSLIFYEYGAQSLQIFCIIGVVRKILALFYQCTVSIMWEQEEAISENVSDKEREKECTSYEENEENEVDRRGRDRERRESNEAK